MSEPDALDSLPIATLLHARLASWFGDDRQAFLVGDLVPVVSQIVAEFQHNALEMARKADIAEARAEEAEFHVEQLRDARDRAERALERLHVEGATGQDTGTAWVTRSTDCPEALAQAHPLDDDSDVALCPDCAGEWVKPMRQGCRRPWHHADEWADNAPTELECSGLCGEHHWLDRPESDTRECLICGVDG